MMAEVCKHRSRDHDAGGIDEYRSCDHGAMAELSSIGLATMMQVELMKSVSIGLATMMQ